MKKSKSIIIIVSAILLAVILANIYPKSNLTHSVSGVQNSELSFHHIDSKHYVSLTLKNNRETAIICTFEIEEGEIIRKVNKKISIDSGDKKDVFFPIDSSLGLSDVNVIYHCKFT